MKPGVRHIPSNELAGVGPGFEKAGWTVLTLSTPIEDRAGLFAAIRKNVPLDPVLASNSNWDALSDSLWGGLDSHSANRFVLIWPNAGLLAERCPRSFATAIEVFTGVAETLADPELTVGAPTALVVAVGG